MSAAQAHSAPQTIINDAASFDNTEFSVRSQNGSVYDQVPITGDDRIIVSSGFAFPNDRIHDAVFFRIFAFHPLVKRCESCIMNVE